MKRILSKICFFLAGFPLVNFIVLYSARQWHLYVDASILEVYKKYNLCSIYLQRRVASFRLTKTGLLILFGTNSVVLVPLGKYSRDALARSYTTYMLMQKTSLTQLVNYNFCMNVIEGEQLYEMDLLKLPRAENIADVFTIKGRECRSRMNGDSFEFSNFDYPTYNLTRLSQHVNVTDVPSDWGFVHGDLTPDNVLVNESGELVLIDLDKSEICGLCIYDDIHYAIESFVKHNRLGWLEALEHPSLTQRYIASIRSFYLLARIYKECSVGACPSSRFYARADLVAGRLINELESW